MRHDKVCKILIVDNDVDYAKKVAYELEQIRPDLLQNHSLEIEISNTAYFVAKRIESFSGKVAPWDIILSDIYMPIPSDPLNREVAQESAELEEIRYENYNWKFWNYNYTWNSHQEGTPEHGGMYLAKKIKELKNRNKYLADLKIVLISDKLFDPSAREKVIEFLLAEKSWFNFYDKTDWDEGTEDWPEHLNNPKIFRWAVIHAINERNSELWGDSLANDDEILLSVSKTMKEIVTQCKIMAKDPTVNTILITGDRGTGKSILASQIHEIRMKTSGATGEFVTVQCTEQTDELFGSQLFGHVKGSFTGAIDNKVGFVEKAKDGTLFFDEIGDLSPPNQGKLLRLLQDKKYVKVGDNQDKMMKVKLVIFATNKNFDVLIEDGDFRLDLYDRMKLPQIKNPSLKDRRDDIIPLAEHFLEALKKDLRLSEDAERLLSEQMWCGNVRELQGVIKQATTYCTSTELKVSDIQKLLPKKSEEVQSLSPSFNNMESLIEITPENIVSGKIKWKRIIKKEPYEFRSAIMIIARSMWRKPQKDLAELLQVNPNNLEQFLSTVKRKIRNDELGIQKLKSHVSPTHYPVLDKFSHEIFN